MRSFDSSPHQIIFDKASICIKLNDLLALWITGHFSVEQKGFQGLDEGIVGLFTGQLKVVPGNGVNHITAEKVGWHFTPLFVNDLEVKFIHRFLQTVERSRMNFAELFQRLVVGEQGEVAAPQVRGEVIHGPDGSLHFKQKRGVVLLVFLQLSTGIGNDAVLTVGFDRGEDGGEASRSSVVPKSGISD